MTPQNTYRLAGVPLKSAGGLPPVKDVQGPKPEVQSPGRTVNVIIRPNVRDRWSSTLLAYYTPERVEVTARSAMGGNLYAIWQMFDLMEQTWPELSTCLNELKDQAIAEITENYTLKSPLAANKKTDPEADRRKDIVEYILGNMQPDIVADENDFEDTLRDMMDDVGKCVSVLEMNFAEDPQTVEIGGKASSIVPLTSTRWVNPKYYGFPMGEGVMDRLMLNTAELLRNNPGSPFVNAGSGQWQDFPPDKFIISIFKQKSGHILSGSLLRQLAGLWAMANFTWEWYLNFVQIFGVPLRIAKVDPNAPDGVKTEIDNLLAEMGSTGYIRLPNGNEIEIKEAMKGGNDSVHKIFLEYIDQICRKRILGQTLTGGEGQHGTQALGKVHANVRNDKIQGAAKRKVKILNAQIIPAICRANFGDTRLMPKFKTPEKDNEDPLEKMQRVQIFTTIAPMAESELYNLAGFKVPEDGEKTIGGPQAAAPNPGEPVFDPNKDIVAQRALWRELHKKETESQTAAAGDAGDWITVNGHPVFIGDKGSTSGGEKANLKEQNDTSSQRSKALGKQGARESGNGRITTGVIAGSASANPAPDESEIARDADGQKAALEKLYAEKTANVEHHSANIIGEGGEHIVEHSQGGDRVIKHTKDGFGFSLRPTVRPLGADVHLTGATPAEYVHRLHAQNEVFGTDARIEGVSKAHSDNVSLVSSQKFIKGTEPSQPVLDSHMKSLGFQKVSAEAIDNKHLSDKTWYHPASGYVVADVKPDNFKQDAKGRIVPIDLIVQHAAPGSDLEKAMHFGTRGRARGAAADLETDPATSIAATLHEIIYPAVDRLKKINTAAEAGVDDSTLKLMTEKLLKDFPHISEVAQCDTALAKQLKPVLQSALAAGLSTKNS